MTAPDWPVPLAETQQDDEHGPGKCVSVADANRVLAEVRATAERLAARPSADTETLRRVLLALVERWESEVTPRSFHRAGTHTDGRSQALADAAADLRAALDGGR